MMWCVLSGSNQIATAEPRAGRDRVHVRRAPRAPGQGLRLQPQHRLVGGQGGSNSTKNNLDLKNHSNYGFHTDKNVQKLVGKHYWLEFWIEKRLKIPFSL